MNDVFYCNVYLSSERINISMDVRAFLKKGTTITFSGIVSYLLKLPPWLCVFLSVLVFSAFIWYTWVNAPKRYWDSYNKRHTKNWVSLVSFLPGLRWWEIENLNNKKPLISEINGKVEDSIELEFKTKLGIEQIGYL